MNQDTTGRRWLDALWAFCTSVRLTVVLLLSLAVSSVFGTLIPQNLDPALYVRQFGLPLYRIFVVLDLVDMYHAGWFRFLLCLLAVNVVACSLDRLPGTLRILSGRTAVKEIGRRRPRRGEQTFSSALSVTDLCERFLPVVKKRFGAPTTTTTPQAMMLVAERGRWTRIGFYLVHLSIVLLLMGGLMGSLFGFDGSVQIPEGETAHMVRLSNGGMVDLGFAVRCDDFSVTFYAGGRPKEFRSRLTILENGQAVLSRDIVVNDPLRYRGVNIFQSSYGMLGPDRYYTGLQVTRDPGVWVVYLGFGFLIAGCYVTFFTSHQRLVVEIVPQASESLVRVSGSANKNRTGMQLRVQQMADALSASCRSRT